MDGSSIQEYNNIYVAKAVCKLVLIGRRKVHYFWWIQPITHE